jgi:UDP-2,3-diacylglucosamine pyrophosphatase LpxH
MGFYEEKLQKFRDALATRGYAVRVANAAVVDGQACPVTVGFPSDVLGQNSFIAVPDVHLSDGSDADIFLDGNPAHAQRFTKVLSAIDSYMDAESASAYLLQLGDWYDVWRAVGADATQADFAKIDEVKAYQDLLELDKRLGMAHLIGNHDASFKHALPDRRVADGARFRFGFGLMKSNGRVFALHGHQTDTVQGAPSPDSDQRAVWLATLAAKYVTSEVRSLQNFFDKEGTNPGAALHWLGALMGLNRPDPVPIPRARLATPAGFTGSFVDREDSAALVGIAVKACAKRYPTPEPLQLLVVGHSHKPCIAVTPHPASGKPVVVVDGGSWVQGAAQLVFGAANRVSVFDIIAAA